ncbi:hypothetical protein [Marinimicrobium sp. ABcell2]|uniref:hypothetical protein n=1 Tax=Marinimicrobium sp. ABcell2 TaxID=3069751 RepID=UPI0027B7B277|nr:hypothetical protein [Marinimicrobium sp. ABcell2]MDQ2077513.1 hypothetical protein [Marinimicrobium sp. ABcell2]
MFDTSNFTRTTETETDYRQRAMNLLERYTRETGKDWDLHPHALLQWLHGFRDGVSPAYWRRTRAALGWYLDELGQAELSGSVRAVGTQGCSKAQHTSAHKKKSVTDEELGALTKYLLSPGASEINVATYYFFVACLITGMRPVEWSRCQVEIITDPKTQTVDEIIIVIQNAKATNGRAHGETRTLRFTSSRLTPQEIQALINHWRYTERKVADGSFPLFQRDAGKKMQYAARKLWPRKKRRITLYSTRHQSMANGKASGLPRAVIAAMHGHATDRTCGDHYGRKQFGKAGRVYAEVSEEEVARVRVVAKDWTPPDRTRINPGNKTNS